MGTRPGVGFCLKDNPTQDGRRRIGRAYDQQTMDTWNKETSADLFLEVE